MFSKILSINNMLALNIIFSIFSSVPWTIIFFFTRFFDIHLYYIKNREDCQRIQKKIQGMCSHTTDGGKGYGYSFGFWYMVSLSILDGYNEDKYTCYIIATKKSFNNLIKETDILLHSTKSIQETVSHTNINIFERSGSYLNPYYRKRTFVVSMKPRPLQKIIIDEIINFYEENNHATVLLYGPPGTGKSIIGILISDILKGSYCNSLRPWQPGDTLSSLYSDIEPTDKNPLILVFDEFDGALLQIHNGTIIQHKNIPICVSDKAGWNKMLDEIQRGMYPYLILILTTNKKPEFFKELDPSYIREGRVNLIFNNTEEIVVIK